MILNISIELTQTRLFCQKFKNLHYLRNPKYKTKIHYMLTSRLLANVIWLTGNKVLNNNIVFTIQSGFINQNTNVVSYVLDFAI